MTVPAPPAPEHNPPLSGFARKYLSRIFPLVSLVVLAMFWGFHAKATSMLRDQLLVALAGCVCLFGTWVGMRHFARARATEGGSAGRAARAVSATVLRRSAEASTLAVTTYEATRPEKSTPAMRNSTRRRTSGTTAMNR